MKTWYASKTLWLNLIAVIALIVQTQTGFVVNPETQAGLLAVINLVLRAITGVPLAWGTSTGDQTTGDKPSAPTDAGCIRLPLLLLVAAFAGLVALTGCATTATTTSGGTVAVTPLQTAGKSLLAVKTSIVTAATSTDGLCRAGTLKPDICAQARAAYGTAKPAYDMAVDAYLLMATGAGGSENFEAALLRVRNIAANMLLIASGTK